MAKKKSKSNKIYIIGTGVALAVIIFLIYPYLIPDQFIVKVSADESIKQGINAGLLKIDIPCYDINECSEGQLFIGEEKPTNPIQEIVDPIPLIPEPKLTCVPPEKLVDGFCNAPELPPVVQPKVELISNITKIDNSGNRYESKTNVSFNLLSFFVEDTSNIDFDAGFIEERLFIKTEPNRLVTGSGNFDVLIGNSSIFSTPIKLDVMGTTDSLGQLTVNFIPQEGIKTKDYTFQFASNINKFATSGITRMDFKSTGFSIKVDDFDYSLDNTNIFQMDIARDPNQIIIVNEEGIKKRAFPVDDKVSLCSSAGKYCYSVCTQHASSAWIGCLKYSTQCTTLPAPAIGAWTLSTVNPDGSKVVFNQDGQFAGSCPLSGFLIKRDQTYELKIGTPNAKIIKWKTPIEQKSFSFSCTTTGSPSGYTPLCNYNDQKFLADIGIVP